MRISEWTSIIDHDRYARLAAILRLPHASPIDPLPPTWHWLYTHESPIDAPLGCDGHVAERPYGVPESHTFRLWAGSEIHSHRDTFVGTRARFRVCVDRAVTKLGRSGSLAFVPVEVSVFDELGCLLVERRTGVYKNSRPTPAPNATVERKARSACRSDTAVRSIVQLDEVALFRYSALLGVYHRIHYDYPYATEVENYPGLVVHGPLIAQMLVFHARTLAARDNVRTIKVVAHRPSFVGEPLRLCAAISDERRRLLAWAEGPDGDDRVHIELNLSAP